MSAVDGAAATAFWWADAEAGAVGEGAGFEGVPGTAELRAEPLLGVGVLLAAADEIVGPGPAFSGCSEEQPETTASVAMAAHRIRHADRGGGRWGHLLFTIISVGRAVAPLFHRDMGGHDGKCGRHRWLARGRDGDDDRGVMAAQSRIDSRTTLPSVEGDGETGP